MKKQHQQYTSHSQYTSAEDRAESEFVLAALRVHASEAPGVDDLVDYYFDHPGSEPVFAGAVERLFTRAIANAWKNGWQPRELAHLVDKGRNERLRRLITDFITIQAQQYLDEPGTFVHPDWLAQLGGLGATPWWSEATPHLVQWCRRERVGFADGLTVAASAYAKFINLPPIPELLPPPGSSPVGHTDLRSVPPSGDKMLDRVRALLAKAESTEFEEEADALVSKVQELMTRHSIDHVMIHSTSSSSDRAVSRRFAIDDPYSAQKAQLIHVVAGANACKAVWMKDAGLSTVFGFPEDIDSVDVLFTSLLVQATASMTKHGSTRSSGGESTTRSFRTAFLDGFANRIGQRLRDARDVVTAEADVEHLGGVSLVLASREVAVAEAVDQAFPSVRSRRSRINNWAGFGAGQEAANNANLNTYGRLKS